MLHLKKGKAEVLTEAINYWSQNNIITQNEQEKLLGSFDIIKFEYKLLAKYCFWFSIISILTAIGSILSDEKLMKLISKIFNAPLNIKFILFSIVTAVIYIYGLRRQKLYPQSNYKNAAILFLANITASGALISLYKMMNLAPAVRDYFLLFSAILYASLAIFSRNKLTWILSVFILATFYGLRVGYLSGWGAYYMGINIPLHFLLFSLLIIILSFVMNNYKILSYFQKCTYKIGLLFTFNVLWILSIFGNYGDYSTWQQVSQIELFHWSILFAIASFAAIYYGIKHDDYTSRAFGVTFLFINIYTRFFEFFWNHVHKAIFFSILALISWLLGSKAENIWKLCNKYSKEKL
jgi:hypothetical protein